MKIFIVLFALFAKMAPGISEAVPVTFNFEGIVDDLYGNELLDLIIGETFHGTITFQSEITDSDARANAGTYYFSTLSPTGMTMSLHFTNAILQTDPSAPFSGIYIFDNAGSPEYPSGPADSYEVVSTVKLPFGNSADVFFRFFTYNNLEFITTDQLLITPPDISLADEFLWTFHINEHIPGGSQSSLLGHITSITPEPATFMLLGLGMMALRKRRS